jgi:hypothetical protein
MSEPGSFAKGSAEGASNERIAERAGRLFATFRGQRLAVVGPSRVGPRVATKRGSLIGDRTKECGKCV